MAESFYKSPIQLGPVLDPVQPAGCDLMRTSGSPHAAGDESRRSRFLLREEESDESIASVEMLDAGLKKMDQRKAHVLNELDRLREKIRGADADSVVETLMLLLRSVKDLERQEVALKSNLTVKREELEAEINQLEAKISSDYDSKSLCEDLDHSLGVSAENLHRAKKELSTRLRAVVSLKRQLDDLPSQSEINQYEYRLLELNMNIAEKDRETRKFYATYNALLETKELMLKEISLLNSINSQFQDAITSSAGQLKLINSMEGILKGIQQKLEKIQVGLQADQKVCDTLRERYAVTVADQRHSFTLLKAFQEQCARNKTLQRKVLPRGNDET